MHHANRTAAHRVTGALLLCLEVKKTYKITYKIWKDRIINKDNIQDNR